MEVSRRIIDRIKKLMLMQDTERGASPQEAANAAQFIQDILTKYNLNMDELNLSDEEKDEPYEGSEFKLHANKKNVNWHRLLYAGLAKANNCRAFIVNKGGANGKLHMTIIGQAHNVQIVNYFYEYLVNTIDEMSLRAAYKNRIMKAQLTWRTSFSHGCTMAIRSRLVDERKKLITQIKQNNQETYALVVRQNSALAEAVNMIVGKFSKQMIKSKDTSAFRQGFAAGQNINLTKRDPSIKMIGEN